MEHAALQHDEAAFHILVRGGAQFGDISNYRAEIDGWDGPVYVLFGLRFKKKKERQVSRVVIRGIEWVIHEEGGIEYPPVILLQSQPLTRVIS